MANPTFEDYTKIQFFLLEQIGGFINSLTGLDVFVTDKPWPGTITPAVGVRIISYDDTGWADLEEYNSSGERNSIINLIATVEFLAVRGNPMPTLAYINQALKGFQELKYKYLVQNNIGFLSTTNVTNHDTVLDGTETEYRARMLGVFSMSISSFDLIGINTIDTVNITQTSKIDEDDTYPVVYSISTTYP